jgi:hypothetical protein
MPDNPPKSRGLMAMVAGASMLGGLSPAVVSIGMYVELVRSTERNATELLSTRRLLIEQSIADKKHTLDITELRIKFARLTTSTKSRGL